MPPTDSKKNMGTYLRVPCRLDKDGEAWCRYKYTRIGCGENLEVTSPDKCQHLKQFVNIGFVDPKYLDSEI